MLEQKGLLLKRGDASDKRLVHLSPTVKGRQLVKRAVPAASLKLGIEKLSTSEGQKTVEMLRALLLIRQHAISQARYIFTVSIKFTRNLNDFFVT